MDDAEKTTESDTARLIREMIERDPAMAEHIKQAKAELAAYRTANGGRIPINVRPLFFMETPDGE